jgi:hypothetical protein
MHNAKSRGNEKENATVKKKKMMMIMMMNFFHGRTHK